MSNLWAIEGKTTLMDFDVCVEDAADEAREKGVVTIVEHRQSTADDVNCGHLADSVWNNLAETIGESEDFACDAGTAELSPSWFREQDERPAAWYALRKAIKSIVEQHVDFSDAAWQTTGKTARVLSDGTVVGGVEGVE